MDLKMSPHPLQVDSPNPHPYLPVLCCAAPLTSEVCLCVRRYMCVGVVIHMHCALMCDGPSVSCSHGSVVKLHRKNQISF